MKRVLILKPRLDVMFKESYVPEERGPISPIRKHWKNFVDLCYMEHLKRGDEVQILELPLWQFTPKIVQDIGPDLVYVPHREQHNFTVPKRAECIETRYYMQTVFPWRFYVDSLGYAGGASFYPMDLKDGDKNGPWFDILREYALSGKSKVDQPPKGRCTIDGDYVFFPCQIPHDWTILHHSKVTVEEALERTCEATQEFGINLVVKGHPVNPGSMDNLKKICTKYKNTTWLNGISIHDIIPRAKAIVVVNSGTGMESLLYLKPVITFGRAEYDIVSFKIGDLQDILEEKSNPNEVEIRKFFDVWCKMTFDTTNQQDFSKLY